MTKPLAYEPTAPTRTFVMPGNGRAPAASVQIGERRPGRWIWAKSVQLSQAGYGGCLGRWTDSPVHDEHETEQEAIAAAFLSLIRYVDGHPGERGVAQIRAWALVLGQPLVQQELFA